MSTNYNANDLKTLSAGRAYREKLGMYLSADKQEAIDLGLRELIYNAQDEFEATRKDNSFVKITINTKTNEICVEDNLRGIPSEIRDDGINSLTAAFLIPHSGAKHEGEQVYKNAVGVNGQGNKIVCHTAKWLKVEVKRDGNIYYQSFHETPEGAIPDENVKILGKTKETGTKITYIPSELVYGKSKIDIDNLKKTLTDLSRFTKKFKIILNVDGKETEYYSENGLIDGLNPKERYHPHPINFFYKDDQCEVELALQWNKKTGAIKPYANNLFVKDGGAFITGFKQSLTKAINAVKGTNFSGDTIRRTLDGYVSVKVQSVQFSNQVKTALANPEARTTTSTATTMAIQKYSREYPQDMDIIIDVLSKEERAEEAAEKARRQVLEASKDIEKAQKRKVFASDKLKDAEFLGPESILLVVEGNSAGASMAVARDVKKYGILYLRGKLINCLSNSDEDIFANEEIKLLLSALNIVPGKYDPTKLRYGRVAICTDSDSDGYHIGLLIMAALRKLAPDFLNENRLYWLRSPLYIVKEKKEEKYYFTDDEMNAVRSNIHGEVQRNKGLGSLSPEQARASMFGPNQRMEQLVVDEDSMLLLELLMGDNAESRKDFIFKNVDFSTIKE